MKGTTLAALLSATVISTTPNIATGLTDSGPLGNPSESGCPYFSKDDQRSCSEVLLFEQQGQVTRARVIRTRYHDKDVYQVILREEDTLITVLATLGKVHPGVGYDDLRKENRIPRKAELWAPLGGDYVALTHTHYLSH